MIFFNANSIKDIGHEIVILYYDSLLKLPSLELALYNQYPLFDCKPLVPTSDLLILSNHPPIWE